MSREHEIVIRDGILVDGSGGEPFVGDIAIDGDRITEVGAVTGRGETELDACGLLVTPGFVDIHTHYDGQAIWSDHLTPSSRHGVTTAVMGNCGVGFAPCRPADHDLLVNAMEGVEDIPEVVMTEGLPWTWESFPEYLDALDSCPRDIDVAQFLPHSPLRVFVMGTRGAELQPATAKDLEAMTAIAVEAMAAGAIGFSTSRTTVHRRGDGAHIASFRADEAELRAIASAVGPSGLLQLVSTFSDRDGSEQDRREEISLIVRLSRATGVTVTLSVSQANWAPDRFDQLMGWIDEANADPQVSIRPQVAPRPVGMHLSFSLSRNPFSACPTYRSIAHLPLERRIIELRRPEVRERIVNEQPDIAATPIELMARQFGQAFPLSDPPDYEPPMSSSVAARAKTRRVPAAEIAYDALLENDGHAMIYLAMSNYAHGNLEHLLTTFRRPDSVIGLGDGGAHYGMVCDASYPTFILTHWVQQRSGGRLGLAEAVRMLTAEPASLAGLGDRGLLAPGLKADLNVIDYDGLQLRPPEVCFDLPGGGRRLNQNADGYRYTLVSGQIIVRDDAFTGARPGRLVRGTRRGERAVGPNRRRSTGTA